MYVVHIEEESDHRGIIKVFYNELSILIR